MSSSSQSGLQVSWLDEELRKEKAVVAALREQIDKHKVAMADQEQRMLSLEDRLAKLQGQLARIPTLEEFLQRTRDDLALRLAELRQDQEKRHTEFLRNRQGEHEQEMRAVAAIESELRRIEPLEQAMAVRQAEDQRLNEVLLRLQQDLEGYPPRMQRGEEATRRLSERIDRDAVKIGQNEQALEAAVKQQQEHLARLLLVETTFPKLGQRITELEDIRKEVTETAGQLLENQRRTEVQRAQVMAEWGRRLEGFNHQLEVWSEQLRYFTDQFEKNRRVLREVQEVSQQVSQQQDQMRQLQRITEEQLRREMREWRSESDRRWAQETNRRERALEEQQKKDDGQDQRLVELEELRRQDLAQLEELEAEFPKIQREYTVGLEHLRQAQLRMIRMQAKAFQEQLLELGGFLGEDGQERKAATPAAASAPPVAEADAAQD